jgi:hypothetical protein
MMLDVSSPSWLNLLHRAKIDLLKLTTYDPSAVKAITKQVIEFNQKYLAPQAVANELSRAGAEGTSFVGAVDDTARRTYRFLFSVSFWGLVGRRTGGSIGR